MHRDMGLRVVGGKERISDLEQRHKTSTQGHFLRVSYTWTRLSSELLSNSYTEKQQNEKNKEGKTPASLLSRLDITLHVHQVVPGTWLTIHIAGDIHRIINRPEVCDLGIR